MHFMKECLEERSFNDSIRVLDKPQRFVRKKVQDAQLKSAVEFVKSIKDFYLFL